MSTFLGQLGMQAASAATGGLMGAVFGGMNDRRQLKQQGKLNQLQEESSKRMMDYQNIKAMDMWQKTNYSAQLAEMKKAGLSTGLMYGGSGPGGATTGNASSSVGGAAAPAGGGEIAMGLQVGLQQAQIENIKADTKKKEVEATKTAGVDTELGKTQIDSLTQGINNQMATERLTKYQTALAGMEVEIKSRTLEQAIDKIEFESFQAEQVFKSLKMNNEITEQTFVDRVNQVKAESAGAIIKNALMRSEQAVNEAQVSGIVQSIKTQIETLKQGNRRLSQQDKQLLIEEARNELIETGIWVQGATQVLGKAVDVLTRNVGGATVTETFTRGPKGTTSTTTETRKIK